MYEQGRCAQIVKEMKRYSYYSWSKRDEVEHLSIIAEVFAETILYSGNPNEGDPHMKGVGIIFSRMAGDSPLARQPVSERIITARFAPKCQKMWIIQVYASTNDATGEEKEASYHQLQTEDDRTPRREMTLVVGDFKGWNWQLLCWLMETVVR